MAGDVRPAFLALGTVLLATTALAASEEEVKQAYDAWNEAFNQGDAAALAALYSDDSLLLPATHDVVEGPEGVQRFFQGLFDGGVTGHALELIEVIEGDETTVAAARWSARGKDASGAEAAFGGIATHV